MSAEASLAASGHMIVLVITFRMIIGVSMRLLYLLLLQVPSLVLLMTARSAQHVELLVLRHEVAVLRRTIRDNTETRAVPPGQK